MIAFCLALAMVEPEEVTVGIYVNQITKLSLKDNQFSVDFWIWFRWKNDALKPHESFEVTNGQIDKKETPTVKKLGDVHYSYVRVVATITKFWDIARYPLDNHRLEIMVEDTNDEEHKLRYVPDRENSSFDPDVKVPGWVTARSTVEVGTRVHRSNYGDTTLPSGAESRYSRFGFSMHLERRGVQNFVKLFIGLLIATLISFLVFFIKPTDLDPRFGLGVGAIFAAIASDYVIAGALPETTQMSLADQLHNVAFVAIFAALVQSVVSLRLFAAGREAASKRLDRISAAALPLLYLGVSAILVLRA